MMTNHHTSYYAHESSRISGTCVDRLGPELFDVCVVDLNPHHGLGPCLLAQEWRAA